MRGSPGPHVASGLDSWGPIGQELPSPESLRSDDPGNRQPDFDQTPEQRAADG